MGEYRHEGSSMRCLSSGGAYKLAKFLCREGTYAKVSLHHGHMKEVACRIQSHEGITSVEDSLEQALLGTFSLLCSKALTSWGRIMACEGGSCMLVARYHEQVPHMINQEKPLFHMGEREKRKDGEVIPIPLTPSMFLDPN